MFRILFPEDTTYITNKAINGKRVEDANVSAASTIDLFKLYEESSLKNTGSAGVVELSRALLKFDLDPLRQLTGSILNLNNFSCSLAMTAIRGGNFVPQNVKLIVFPLSRSFDQGGLGRDVVSFSDLSSPNWLTASTTGGSLTAVSWSVSGANGLNQDYITGTVALGNLHGEQLFKKGTENLLIDVSKIVSATLVEAIEDHGFRLSYSSSYEDDTKSYWVLRFASMHSTNPSIRPRLLVRFNDAIQDHHKAFFFDLSGSLFLNSFARGQSANLLSGTSLTPITGTNSLVLKLESGSFSKIITGSQHQIGSNFVSGVYSSSFAISSEENSALRQEIRSAGSCSFTEIWGSLDGTLPFLTASNKLVIRELNRSSFSSSPRRLVVNITNMRSEYSQNEKTKFLVRVFDVDENVKVSKLPVERKSIIMTNMYYQLVDSITQDIILPYDIKGEGDGIDGTLLSTNSNGMEFEIFVSDLSFGRTYEFQFKIKDLGTTQEFRTGQSFRVIA